MSHSALGGTKGRSWPAALFAARRCGLDQTQLTAGPGQEISVKGQEHGPPRKVLAPRSSSVHWWGSSTVPRLQPQRCLPCIISRGLTASTEGWAWPETLSPDPEGTGRSVLLQASGSWQDTWGFPPSAKTPRTDMVITQDQRDTHWLPIFLITTI